MDTDIQKKSCLICDEKISVHTFEYSDYIDEYITLHQALCCFSTKLVYLSESKIFLCRICVKELAIAHKFLTKIQEAEARIDEINTDFLEPEEQPSTSTSNTKNDDKSDDYEEFYLNSDTDDVDVGENDIFQIFPAKNKENIILDDNEDFIISDCSDVEIVTSSEKKQPHFSLTKNVTSILSNARIPKEKLLVKTLKRKRLNKVIDVGNKKQTSVFEESQFETNSNRIVIMPQFIIRPKSATNSPEKHSKTLTKAATDDDDITSDEVKKEIIIIDGFESENVEINEHSSSKIIKRIDKTSPEESDNLKMLDVAAIPLDLKNPKKVNYAEVLPHRENEDDMFVCQYCPKAFSSPHHLILHTRKSHVCQFCLESFTKSTDLHHHVKTIHDKFKCTFCPRQFSNNSNLRSHLRKNHNFTLPAHVSLITIEGQQIDQLSQEE